MMMKRTVLALTIAVAVAALALPATAEEQVAPPRLKWSFAGPFGKYDPAQLQRGFKIYREVCSVCHSIQMLAFRNLADPGGPGFSEAQAAAVAAESKIQDLDDKGEPIERPGRLADYFPSPFPNELAAKAVHGGSLRRICQHLPRHAPTRAVSLGSSLMHSRNIRSRDPITSPPISKGTRTRRRASSCRQGGHYNEYFPGHNIAMPPPLQAGQVTFDDGAPQTVDQYSRDIAAFLMWVAEPHLVQRKRIGFQAMIFLIVLAGLMYFTKKKVWSAVH